MRDANDFCDVTLVSEGNQQIKAHKVILASSSSVFMEILKSNQHNHPLIYMRGIQANDLEAIVDFLYHGETNVYQENLDAFLVLAEEFKLKGLSGNETSNADQANQVKQEEQANYKTKKIKDRFEHIETLNELNEIDTTWKTKSEISNALISTEIQKIRIVDNATDLADLNDKLDSMVEKVNGNWTCTVCGKTSNLNKRNDVRRHAETHVEGVSHPCNYCDKIFRCSNALRMHLRKCYV